MTDPTQMEAWVETLAGEFGIDTADVDIEKLLDLARDAAHAVSRPAAPLTTFLVGYAVAQGGGGVEDLDDALATATTLARQWTEEMPG